jgi:hypothetical protein
VYYFKILGAFFMLKRKIFACLLGLSLFVAPANLNASLFSQNSYLRKSFRIAGGVGLITLFAERMISNARREEQFDLLSSLLAVYCCYSGFKILSQDL